MSRIILWLRNDLRLHDNYALNWAMQYNKTSKKEILPVFCFDPRIYSKTSNQTKWQTQKTGLIRARFQLETIDSLRSSFQKIGSNLILSNEKPDEFLPKLLDKDSHNIIVYQQEICHEELQVEDKLQKSIPANISAEIESVWGNTLHHLNDLSYNPKEYLPHIYGKFREKNATVPVRPLLPNPTSLPWVEKSSKIIDDSIKYTPTLEEFGFTKEQVAKKPDARACYKFKGGEENGLFRMNEYIFEKKNLGHYAQTRNNLIGAAYSSKLSPWLANGSLSCRQVYHATRDFEKKHRANDSTKVFIDELYWRDFNRYWLMRHGNRVFSSYGIYDRQYYDWHTDMTVVKRW